MRVKEWQIPQMETLMSFHRFTSFVVLCWFAWGQLFFGEQSRCCNADDAVVVRPADWSSSLEQWKQYRLQQGTQIYEVDAELGQVEIQKKIRELKSQHPGIKFLLLAGDVSAQKTTIPTFYKSSKAMVQFRGPPTIATDSPYADLDDDEIPDLVMGRLPADSGEQLAKALARVIAYEQTAHTDLCQRDVHIVAGVGGFGMLADSVIEMTTKSFLSDRIPGWSNVSMTQASLSSNYCPDPRAFDEACIDKFNSGSAFWVYIGHGHVENLDFLRVKETEYLPILHVGHLPAMQCQISKSPIAVFLACYTGAFDAQRDSLAERLVLKPDGAIAAIASTRVSGPYGLAMLSNGLLDQFYQQRTETLGEIVHLAKRSMLEEKPLRTPIQVPPIAKSRQLQMIESIASAMSPQDYDLRQERLEHVWEMHLIGDPLLRPRYPREIQLEVPKRVAPGQQLLVQGKLTDRTNLQVELALRRQDLPADIASESVDSDSEQGRQGYQGRYERANAKVIARLESVKESGDFDMQFQIPEDLPRGRYCIRAFGETAENWSTGYAEFTVRPPTR